MDELPALSNAVLLPSSSSGEGGRVPFTSSCCTDELHSILAWAGRALPSDFSVAILGKMMAVTPLQSASARKRDCTARGLEKSSTCQIVQQVNAWEDST